MRPETFTSQETPRIPKRKTSLKAHGGRLSIILAVLSLSNAVSILYGCIKSPDGLKALAIQTLVAYFYAVTYVLIVRGHRFNTLRLLAIYHGVLGAVTCTLTYLYYVVAVDWRGIDNGKLRLTLLHSVIHSGLTWYAIYGAFLILIAVASYTMRKP